MRWLFRLLFACIILVFVAVAALFLIPTERIANLVEQRFENGTGRALFLDGEIRPTVWPRLGVRIGSVALANAEWSDEGPMLSAERLSVGIDPMALIFQRKIEVEELKFDAPRVMLQKSADGSPNWRFSSPAAPASGTGTRTGDAGAAADGGVSAFTIALAEITDGEVTYHDASTGTFYQIGDLDATLRLPDFDGAAQIDLSGVMKEQSLSASATLDAFSAALAGEVVPVALKVGIGGSTIDFSGRGGTTPALEGTINADLADMAALLALVDQAPPDLPKGLGQKARIDGQLTLASEGSVHLREARIDLDHNTLTGDIDVFPEDVPRIHARLSADVLDLSSLAGFSAENGSSAGGAAAPSRSAGGADGWPKNNIDVRGLGAVDGEFAFRIESIDLGSATVGPVDSIATLDRARLVFDMREFGLYRGNVTGEFVVNGREGLSVRGDLDVANVAVQPLLSGFADYDRLIGTANFRTSFLGVGNSVDAIMNSLSGDGSFSIGKGELLGLDLVGMLRNLDISYRGAGQKTIFDGISASYTIADGVLRNQDLQFSAPLARASGAGRVGLGTQTLNYRVVPTALQSSDGTGGIRVPVLITGPWASPKFRPDLESLIDENFEEEKRRLEAEAKARVEAEKAKLEEKVKTKVMEELNVRPAGTKSIEDTAKQKLENELKKGLGKLLGGN
ncbi:MAG: AsmA family protein [Pseudomonadota bacterium]